MTLRALTFPDWRSALDNDGDLTAADRNSFAITIHWFPGYCKKASRPATCEEPRVFVRKAVDINLFLDGLAVRDRVAAGTQRQGLNALVFRYRDVYGRELGHFVEHDHPASEPKSS